MDSWKRSNRHFLMLIVSIFLASPNTIANGESDSTNYILYVANGSSQNSQELQKDEDFEIALNGKTVILIHDEYQNPETALIRELKDALIEVRQTNVIIVNWTAPKPPGTTEHVGADLKELIENLVDEEVVNKTDLHCIGFGFGADICGIAGNLLKADPDEIVLPRISGLNPRTKAYKSLTISRLVSSGDAEFVDIIHTYYPGTPKPIGDVDFYPNNYLQPGCGKDTNCSYERALRYYISSVRKACQFISKPCADLISLRLEECEASEDNYGQMGYDSLESPGRGVQYLETTETEPFC